MRKIMMYISIALSVVILVAVTITLSNPLRKSQEQIRDSILKLTPLGASMDDVLRVIESNKEWETRYVNYEHGYMRPGRPDPADIALNRETIVGEKSIRVFIGEYRNIFVTSVTTFWGFDENSELIDVYVWKDTDAL